MIDNSELTLTVACVLDRSIWAKDGSIRPSSLEDASPDIGPVGKGNMRVAGPKGHTFLVVKASELIHCLTDLTIGQAVEFWRSHCSQREDERMVLEVGFRRQQGRGTGDLVVWG
jgi:hypothetical protein